MGNGAGKPNLGHRHFFGLMTSPRASAADGRVPGARLSRIRKASLQAIKQDSPPLYGGERKHPRLDPGVIREPLPDDVLVRRVDDNQDLTLTLERSAKQDEPRLDKTVHETSMIFKAELPAQVSDPVPCPAPPLANSVKLHGCGSSGVTPYGEFRLVRGLVSG